MICIQLPLDTTLGTRIAASAGDSTLASGGLNTGMVFALRAGAGGRPPSQRRRRQAGHWAGFLSRCGHWNPQPGWSQRQSLMIFSVTLIAIS